MSRRRLGFLGAALAVALSSTISARAQGVDEFGPYGGLEDRKHFASPQHAALELRFGPYFPHVDDSIAGTPYEDVFGTDRRFLVGFEVDWQALRLPKIGSLGPGIGVGTFSAKARAPLEDGSGRSGERTRLKLLPTYLVAVARVDALSQLTRIPLTIYGKAGLGYALWWARGEDHLERADGVVGKGSSYGYQLAAGGTFLLDALDPSSALEMDSNTGINSVHVFFEVTTSNLDGFGSGRMDVGATTWMTGLLLEI
jgi:hypothetical protein